MRTTRELQSLGPYVGFGGPPSRTSDNFSSGRELNELQRYGASIGGQTPYSDPREIRFRYCWYGRSPESYSYLAEEMFREVAISDFDNRGTW